PPAAVAGDALLATDDASAATALGLPVLWLGEPEQAPGGAHVPPNPEEGGLLGHPRLDALAEALQVHQPSHLVWVDAAAADADDLGTPLAETMAALADAAQTELLTQATFDEDQVRDFLPQGSEAQDVVIPELDEPAPAVAEQEQDAPF